MRIHIQCQAKLVFNTFFFIKTLVKLPTNKLLKWDLPLHILICQKRKIQMKREKKIKCLDPQIVIIIMDKKYIVTILVNHFL